MAADLLIKDHQAWLGYLQPDGLVVSPAALVDAQVLLPQNTLPLQDRFLPFVQQVEVDGRSEISVITDFLRLGREFFDWPDDCVGGANENNPIPESLTLPLPEFGLTLSPSLAFKDPKPKDPENPWLLLVQTLPLATDLDAHQTEDESGWNVSHSRRFERLLRETKVPIGLLINGTHLRLIYAPHGENSGSLTFPVAAMTEVAGRPILAALHLLLDHYRLIAGPSEARLPALLARSRDYQSRVSEALAQQVLDSLYELQRGFQAANERTAGELFRTALNENPDDVYAGLLTVLMRLVFLLFAEDRGLMPTSELYVRNYSIHGLFERLRSDNEHYPDTMDQRYGAWAQLQAIFRVVYYGCRHPQLHMPARHGHLFDPSRFPFLDGSTTFDKRPPLVSDGTIFRILEKLLILGGERLSYRTLDVEEIGSVYQTIMGFRLEVTAGPSIAIIGKRKHRGEIAAPTVINLQELLAKLANERPKWLKDRTGQEISGEAEKALKSSTSVDGLLAALDRKIARNATPGLLSKGAMILQPTDERRRSGSHYTPRSFTEPIVRTTLRPILKRFGEHPTPEQILDLKVCDLAVGSGAFLVEACRQLGDALIKAWQHHGERPSLPPDETEELLSRRTVAQRCLYAVDRNPMAADLAKLSLWLATLAKDHPFTFLDHAVRSGDALVGLTRTQIADFHWLPLGERVFGQNLVESRIRTATNYRKRILDGGDFLTPAKKQEQLDLADEALKEVRFVGNLVIAAFFSASTNHARQLKRDEFLHGYTSAPRTRDPMFGVEEIDNLIRGDLPVTPFHWEIEFPEVFDRENGGFDAVVGNPPYAGKNNLLSGNREGYLDWLKSLHEESHGNADLVAHFFRSAFNLLRRGGTSGLIATNTIRQGDTRQTGLRWICAKGGGTIYAARRRYKWPGQAAVVVSVVWIVKGTLPGRFDLDGKPVPIITAYLFHDGGHENPAVLAVNQSKSFRGSFVSGMGFTFDDTDRGGVASSLSLMNKLVALNKHNANVIFPYLGGEEVNTSPTHRNHRFIINFGEMPLRRAELDHTWTQADSKERKLWLRTGVVPLDYPDPVAADWPDLLRIVEERVKPERDTDNRETRRRFWWRYGEVAPALYRALCGSRHVLAISQVAPHHAFAFLIPNAVFGHTLNVFALSSFAAFSVLQSGVHETWARLLSSSMKDDMRYTISDCFETFPFPQDFESNAALEATGRHYYNFRAALMIKNDEGLTKTYNQFHNPAEDSADILGLRELHLDMDRVVLEAFGWNDIAEAAQCKFLLDYEDEDNEDDSRTSRRRKPWRYRWPDEIRDEVLARLLTLNAQRAEQERLAGLADAAQSGRASKARKPRKRKVNKGQQRFI
jgi:hypothetical protein